MTSGKRPSQRKYRKLRSQLRIQAEANLQSLEDYYLYYQQGLHWCKYRECDPAIDRFNQVIRLNPTLVDAYFQRGFMYYYRAAFQRGAESDFDLAVNDFRQVLRLESDHMNAYDYLMMTNSRRHHYDEVIADCLTAIQRFGNGRTTPFFVYMAYAYQAKKEYDKAIGAFAEAYRFDSDSTQDYESRGRGYLERGEYDAALSDGLKMIAQSPEDFRAYDFCGDVFAAKGELAEAIKYYRKAVDLNQH